MAKYDGSVLINTKINVKNAEVQLSSLENRMSKTADKISDLRGKMDALGKTKIPTPEYTSLEKELSMSEKKLDQFYGKIRELEKSGGVTPKSDIKELRQQIMDMEKELFRLVNVRDHLSTQDPGLGLAKKEVEDYEKKLDDLKKKLEEQIATNKKVTNSSSYKNAIAQIGIYDQKIVELRNNLDKLEQSGKAFTLGSDSEKYADYSRQLQYAQNDLSVMAQKHDILNNKINNSKNSYKNLGDSARKAFSKINKSSKKTNGFLGTMASRFKGLALSLIIFNQISKAFNAMTRAVSEGFKNLYKDSESFKISVDSLKASSETLKNSFAAAFRPLVEIAIPYIQRLIDYITKLLGLFGQFTALITGQKTYTKAIKQTAAATKEAAKEAKGYLSPLDEINQYSTQDNSGDDAGAGGTMFEEVPINQKLIDFFDKIAAYAKKLKDIFNQGFWDGLGDWEYRWKSIKDSIASIKDSLVDIWTDPKVLKAADRWAQSVAYLLGSIVGSVASVGLTIATNLLGGIAKYLEQNKERIKEYLVSIFDIWSDINDLLSSFFQSFAYVFEAFASENGQQLTANLIGIFTDAFMGVTEISSKLIRDILNIFIQPFVDNKEAFRTALEGFLGALATVAGTIKDAIDDTFDKLNGVYDEHFNPFFDSVAQGLSDLVGEFLTFWNGNVQPILDQMAADFDELWKTHIQPAINNFIELLGKVVDVLKALWENVLQPFISWFIQNILPVILPAIQAIWDKIVVFASFIADTVNNIITVLGGIIDFLLGVFTGDWDRAFEGIKSIVEGVLNQISDFVTAVLDSIRASIELALSIIKGIIDAIISVIKGIVESSTNHVNDVVLGGLKSAKESFGKFKEDLGKLWHDTWSSLGDTVKSIIETIKNTIGEFFDWVSDKVSGIIDSINSIGKKSSITRTAGNRFLSSRFSTFRSAPTMPYASPTFDALRTAPIPKLATGAVIPANKEFLAVLGDQKHGTNIEAPLDTIKQANEEAVLNVLSKLGMAGGNMGGTPVNIILQVTLDGQVLGQKMVDWGKLQQMATGNNPYNLGTA